MVNLCTISDGNFLTKGLSLYESLLSTSSNFTLHYLLTDDSHESVKKYENEKLKFYSYKDVCESNSTLNQLKESQDLSNTIGQNAYKDFKKNYTWELRAKKMINSL